MITIEQIKDALKAHIAEAEAATPGPWEAWQELYEVRTNYVRIRTSNDVHLRDTLHGYCGRANATFIAHARTMSPLVCRGYLQTIEWLEEVASYTGELYCPGDEYAHGVEYGKSIIGVKAYRRLESIRQEWHNLATK